MAARNGMNNSIISSSKWQHRLINTEILTKRIRALLSPHQFYPCFGHGSFILRQSFL
jgi:hypothetical protein